jgi:hypothetical protein
MTTLQRCGQCTEFIRQIKQCHSYVNFIGFVRERETVFSAFPAFRGGWPVTSSYRYSGRRRGMGVAQPPRSWPFHVHSLLF